MSHLAEQIFTTMEDSPPNSKILFFHNSAHSRNILQELGKKSNFFAEKLINYFNQLNKFNFVIAFFFYKQII
jgi:hypothetical protein